MASARARREPATPTHEATTWRVSCPRHLWPTAHEALRQAGATITTGRPGSTVEVIVDHNGATVLERLGLHIASRAGRDPWARALATGEGVERYRTAKPLPPDDPLERLFRLYAERSASAAETS